MKSARDPLLPEKGISNAIAFFCLTALLEENRTLAPALLARVRGAGRDLEATLLSLSEAEFGALLQAVQMGWHRTSAQQGLTELAIFLHSVGHRRTGA